MRRKGIAVIGPAMDWQAHEDMQTLRRAEEIRRDPKRLEAAAKRAEEHMTELSRVKRMKPIKEAAPRRRTTSRKP